MKYIIQVDKKTGERVDFLWPEKGEPPPLIEPRIIRDKKRRPGKSKQQEMS